MFHARNYKPDVNTFYFDTLSSLRGDYRVQILQYSIANDNNSITIRTHSNYLSSISFKFGNFAQKINLFAKSNNIEYIKITIHDSRFLSSFYDVIGINDINNIKSIEMVQHAFSIIYTAEMHILGKQLEFLNFNAHYGTATAPCVDFVFLNNVPRLKVLYLTYNTIQCVKNFMTIRNMSYLSILSLYQNNITSLNLNVFQGTNIQEIHLGFNQMSRFGDDDNHTCLDMNSFNNMSQLKKLHLGGNKIECIVNFESIQQHPKLKEIYLSANHLLTSTIDFTNFDESKPLMNSLELLYFREMNLKYTSNNNGDNNCFDVQFLKFMPNVKYLHLSHNKIQCIDNLSISKNIDIKLGYLYLQNNSLLSFDFGDLIGSGIKEIDLTINNLSLESLKNFDIDTISQIRPDGDLRILIIQGNDRKVAANVNTLQSAQVQIQ